jgi:RNA-binding protein
VVSVGNKGVTDSVRAEFDRALNDHELIKVKLGGDDRGGRAAQIADLAGSGAEVVQAIGKVACFYRRNDEHPKIALPR